MKKEGAPVTIDPQAKPTVASPEKPQPVTGPTAKPEHAPTSSSDQYPSDLYEEVTVSVSLTTPDDGRGHLNAPIKHDLSHPTGRTVTAVVVGAVVLLSAVICTIVFSKGATAESSDSDLEIIMDPEDDTGPDTGPNDSDDGDNDGSGAVTDTGQTGTDVFPLDENRANGTAAGAGSTETDESDYDVTDASNIDDKTSPTIASTEDSRRDEKTTSKPVVYIRPIRVAEKEFETTVQRALDRANQQEQKDYKNDDLYDNCAREGYPDLLLYPTKVRQAGERNWQLDKDSSLKVQTDLIMKDVEMYVSGHFIRYLFGQLRHCRTPKVKLQATLGISRTSGTLKMQLHGTSVRDLGVKQVTCFEPRVLPFFGIRYVRREVEPRVSEQEKRDKVKRVFVMYVKAYVREVFSPLLSAELSKENLQELE